MNSQPTAPANASSTPGFQLHERGRSRIWLREDYQQALLAFPIEEPARLAALYPAPLKGRGQVGLINIHRPGHEPERLVLRPYLRGGLMGRLFHDRYFDSQRSLKELELYQEARRRNIPSLEVLGAITRECRGLGYRHGIITRYLEGVEDLAALIARSPSPELQRPGLQKAALKCVGQTLRQMHDGGFNHADLNLKNILVRVPPEADAAALESWVIDFDGGQFHDAPLSRSQRRRNLIRLLRSFVKFHKKQPDCFTTRVALELAHAYFGDDSHEREAFIRVARKALQSSLRMRFSSWKASTDPS